MFGGGGSSTPEPPKPPPPAPSPPTYASVTAVKPRNNIGRFGALDDTILTGPMGLFSKTTFSPKTLLGA